jgi:surfeit locus 1 family protein
MTLRIGTRAFAARPSILLATLVLIAAFMALGFWQLERMRDKQRLFDAFAHGALVTRELADIDPGPDARFTHVAATGHYDSAHQFLLDNMTHAGRAGFRVMTPFVRDQGIAVLVDRGWLPLGATREQLPQLSIAEDARRITGRLDELPSAGIELPPSPAAATWPRVLSYPRHAELSAALDRPLYPQIIRLDPDQPDGYVREWSPSTFPPERHLGYAVTWFALATTVAAAFVVVNLHTAPRET